MKKLEVVHPLLFAVFPVLFLYSYNIGIASLDQIWRPMVVIVAFTVLSWLCLTFVLKSKVKAGIIVSIFLVFFFSYGHIFKLVDNRTIEGIAIGQHKYIFPLWGLALVLCLILLFITRKDLNKFSQLLNLMAAFLVISSIATAVYGSTKGMTIDTVAQTESVDVSDIDRYPDIYYFILDECSRTDDLNDLYELDISEFNEDMTKKGFYIASRSTSNYATTPLSIASSLNYTYLDDLVRQVGPEYDDYLPLRQMIQDNRVVDYLKQRGYMFVSFASGINYTEIKSADRYMSGYQYLSEFENIIINTTPFVTVINKLFSNISNFQYDLHRFRILYPLEKVGEISNIDSPTFTFADGNYFITQWGRDEYIEGYRGMFTYILGKLEESIDEVISNSETKPIIIIQADHGGGSMMDYESLENTNIQERMAIFNIYYLPYGGNDLLYPEITPVNTFRVIFNHYFNANLELLEDKNYYSTQSLPFKFTDVTEMGRH